MLTYTEYPILYFPFHFPFSFSFQSEHSGISYINKSHLNILNPQMRDPGDIPIARFYQVEKWLEVLNPNSHLALVSMVGESQMALDVSSWGAIPSFWRLRCINGHLQSSSRQYWSLFCADALISGDLTPPCTSTEHHLNNHPWPRTKYWTGTCKFLYLFWIKALISLADVRGTMSNLPSPTINPNLNQGISSSYQTLKQDDPNFVLPQFCFS